MATKSLERIAAARCKVESTYNTDPTIAADGSDDLCIIDSPNMVDPEFNFVSGRPHSTSFTYQTKDILSSAALPIRVRCRLQGAGALGTVAGDSFKALDALLRSAGMDSAATPTTGPVTYTPQAIGSLETAWFDIEHHGQTQEVGGCVGNVTLTATNGQPVLVDYQGVGLYRDPVNGTFSGYDPIDRAEAFLGVTGGIKPNGGNTYNKTNGLVLDGFVFNRGGVIQRCMSALETYGIAESFFADARPTLQVTLAMDTGSANLDASDIPPDITGRTDHGVEFKYGTTPNSAVFGFPTAQLLGVTKGVANGYRTMTLNYLIRHSTAESEFSIKLGNESLAIAT